VELDFRVRINNACELKDDEERLTSVGIISPLINECLQVFAVLHLRLIFFSHVTIPFRLGGVELAKVPVRQGR
jgi:hypothetical protein